jgi:hypothetical protein
VQCFVSESPINMRPQCQQGNGNYGKFLRMKKGEGFGKKGNGTHGGEGLTSTTLRCLIGGSPINMRPQCQQMQ